MIIEQPGEGLPVFVLRQGLPLSKGNNFLLDRVKRIPFGALYDLGETELAPGKNGQDRRPKQEHQGEIIRDQPYPYHTVGQDGAIGGDQAKPFKHIKLNKRFQDR